MMRKKKMTREEHIELAKDLAQCQRILEPWINRFYASFSVKGRECKELNKTLNLISSKLCCSMDIHWYADIEEGKCPYYGPHKSASSQHH